MIAWSIEAAQKSGCFDRIIVSTDDLEVASIAKNCGAEVPFLRPPELADDHTGTMPVISHAIMKCMESDGMPELTCCIYATAPFIQASDLRRGLEEITCGSCDYAFSVTTYPFPIQRALRLVSDGRLEMFDASKFNVRSQDLEEAYHDAGQFYWGRTAAWLEGRLIFSRASVPITLPRYRVQDIDTIEDWIRAEYMFQALDRVEK